MGSLTNGLLMINLDFESQKMNNADLWRKNLQNIFTLFYTKLLTNVKRYAVLGNIILRNDLSNYV